LPVTGSIGSIPVSFAFRFGFDAIFAAIGFSGAVDPDRVVVDVVAACLDREPDVVAPAVVAVGLADVDFAGLPTVVGFPVLCVIVDVAGLPLVVGFPVPCVIVDATGLPVVVGFPDVGGLLAGAVPQASANAGDSVKDIAATKPRIVAETRMRVPP
jgi:hypothetical protein